MQITRRRKRIALLILVLFLIVIPGVLSIAFSGPTIRDDFRLIHDGMKLDDVKAIWGTPGQVVETRENWRYAVWDAIDGRVVVDFKDGRVARMNAYPVDRWDWLWTRIRWKFRLR